MYVLIDRDNMLFLWKATDYNFLSYIATIEVYGRVSSCLYPISHSAFSSLTHLELKLLYRNTTGQELIGLSYTDAVTACVACAWEMEGEHITNKLLNEAREQASWVDTLIDMLGEGDSFDKQFRFQNGSNKPTELLPGVSYGHIKHKPPPPSYPIFGTYRYAPPVDPKVMRAYAAGTPQIDSTPIAVAPRPKTEPRVASTTPRGSVSAAIWEVADKIWNDAGAPQSKTVVLALRKRMMEVLESQGTKRNSASNELGNWQKARII